MDKKPFYITTAIVYPNSRIHLGFAWEVVATDMVARFKKLNNYDVYFSTGMDEHSRNVEKKAVSIGKTPKKYCDEMADDIKKVFKQLQIGYDRFIRTSDQDHEKIASKMINNAYEKGDIYKNRYGGYYCESCETFYTEKELLEGNLCPVHKIKANWEEEDNYFFKLTKYQDQLLKFHEDNPKFIQPESRRQEVLQFIKTGLRDFSVSRSNFSWGVKTPFDKDHVIYVWYDALINYITAIGYSSDEDKFKKYWGNVTHIIGKDITRFHAIYWPAMLMSADIDLPNNIFAHGFLNLKGEKMSSSKGNFVTPDEIIEKYGSDHLRYYLLADNNFSADGNFSIENLENRINADLVNDLGNLISRTLSMQKKYFSCDVKKVDKISELDKEIINKRVEIFKNSENMINSFDFHEYIKSIWSLISLSNRYIVKNEPWKLHSEGNIERLSEVMYTLLDTLYFISIMVEPIIPETSKKIVELLGVDVENFSIDLVKEPYSYSSNHIKDTNYKLFSRIEKKEKKKVVKKGKKLKNLKKEIEIDLFKQVDLRVGKVLEVERVENSDKLYKIKVDIGEIREVVSGIAKHYPEPTELIGKWVVFVANLKPAELMGITSEGMILAASSKKKLSLLTTDNDMQPGMKIS